MRERFTYQIRPAVKEEWESAMSLAWRTFQRFDAPDYSKRGIESFLDFISDTTLYKVFLNGGYKLFVAVENGEIIGLISLRETNHISLLFVEEKYHRRGVGRGLIQYAMDYLKQAEGLNWCTVNAAPYGKEFYHRLGFTDTGMETENDGIRYTPMKLVQ